MATTLNKETLEQHNVEKLSAHTGKRVPLSQPSLSQTPLRVRTTSETAGSSTAGSMGGKGLAGLMMMKRRMRSWKKGGGGASTMGGSSVKSGPKLALENSYRLEPLENQTFNEERVKTVMEESIKLFMGKQTGYNPLKSAQVSRYLSEDIKSRVKKLNFTRYKFVVHVMVGQSNEQGMQYSTRCVWDPSSDNVATSIYRHKDLFIVANVFATYFE